MYVNGINSNAAQKKELTIVHKFRIQQTSYNLFKREEESCQN